MEQAFGSLKRRFPILYSITRIEPPKVQEFIYACIVLYNIAIELIEQTGQEVSRGRRSRISHPPFGVNVRDFVTAHL